MHTLTLIWWKLTSRLISLKVDVHNAYLGVFSLWDLFFLREKISIIHKNYQGQKGFVETKVYVTVNFVLFK